jgi:hypothetical protein
MAMQASNGASQQRKKALITGITGQVSFQTHLITFFLEKPAVFHLEK